MCAIANVRQSQIEMWHERLGHLNIKDIKSMCNTQAIFGMKLDANFTTLNCKTYAGKLMSIPFPIRGTRFSGILDMHTDVCGPMRTESEGLAISSPSLMTLTGVKYISCETKMKSLRSSKSS